MARIWFSVCGEGNGHAIRSHTVLKKLKGHEIFITAAENAYPYLGKRHKHVYKLLGNTYVYEKNSLNRILCVLKFLVNLPFQVIYDAVKILYLLQRYKPEVIVSDFESGSHYFARILNLPCINIDNIHILTESKIKQPIHVKPIVRFLHPKADYFLIPAFTDFMLKNKRARIVAPIVRDEIINAVSEEGSHVLVYQTSDTNTQMIPILKCSNEVYRIYGMHGKSSKNIKYMQFSEKRFIDDLRTCKYVIVNGGFTVISEALYLGKPVLAVPVKHQVEQEFNARQLKKAGFGSYTLQLSLSDLKSFDEKISSYKKNIDKKFRKDNHELVRELQKLLKRMNMKSNRFLK